MKRIMINKLFGHPFNEGMFSLHCIPMSTDGTNNIFITTQCFKDYVLVPQPLLRAFAELSKTHKSIWNKTCITEVSDPFPSSEKNKCYFINICNNEQISTMSYTTNIEEHCYIGGKGFLLDQTVGELLYINVHLLKRTVSIIDRQSILMINPYVLTTKNPFSSIIKNNMIKSCADEKGFFDYVVIEDPNKFIRFNNLPVIEYNNKQEELNCIKNRIISTLNFK